MAFKAGVRAKAGDVTWRNLGVTYGNDVRPYGQILHRSAGISFAVFLSSALARLSTLSALGVSANASFT